jgi:tRNA G18 (ribose-2'-O)-methylase SpoU
MSSPIDVDDVDDPRLADFRDLTRADRRPDRPGGRGLVVAEGAVVVERLFASPYPVRALLGVAAKYELLKPVLAGRGVPYYRVDAELMAAVVGFHLNRGVLAVADRAPFPSAAELILGARTVAVLEGVGDVENLGGIFRNAAAFGIDAVLLMDGCGDPLYRRSVRVSMGNVLLVPFARLPGPAEAVLDELRRAGLTVVALTPRWDATPLRDYRRPERLALLLGAEGPGLSPQALAGSDALLRIPMAPGVDSLNVATAAAVAFAALADGG